MVFELVIIVVGLIAVSIAFLIMAIGFVQVVFPRKRVPKTYEDKVREALLEMADSMQINTERYRHE